MIKAQQALEKFAKMPCKLRTTGEGIGNVCLSDCVCRGTGLRFPWLTKECPCLSPYGRCDDCWSGYGHRPSCTRCNGWERVFKSLEELQVYDLARVATALGYQLVVHYHIDRWIYPPLDVSVADYDKEDIVATLEKVLNEHSL